MAHDAPSPGADGQAQDDIEATLLNLLNLPGRGRSSAMLRSVIREVSRTTGMLDDDQTPAVCATEWRTIDGQAAVELFR